MTIDFDKWYLDRSLCVCQNNECKYLGRLNEFADTSDVNVASFDDFTIEGKCPQCGASVRLTVTPHVDFYVFEELEVRDDKASYGNNRI